MALCGLAGGQSTRQTVQDGVAAQVLRASAVDSILLKFSVRGFINWTAHQTQRRIQSMNTYSIFHARRQRVSSALSLVARDGLLVSGLVALVLGWQPFARAQTDDFNDGDDAGWTHLDLSAVGFPASLTSYTFPDDGLGGKAYRIHSSAPPIPDAGPARAFGYQAPDYTRFSVAVDTIGWDLTVDHAFGLLVRATSIGIGSTDGYVMN